MKTNFIAIISITLCAITIDAQAILIRGSGSCGNWIQETQSSAKGEPSMASSFWILGYLSGMASESGKDVLRNTDALSIEAWITNYCRANPLDKFHDAGDALFIELKKRQGR